MVNRSQIRRISTLEPGNEYLRGTAGSSFLRPNRTDSFLFIPTR
jgi:hypothetical protein